MTERFNDIPDPKQNSELQPMLIEQFSQIVGKLDNRERMVLVDRFGLEDGVPKTLVEVGEKISRSESTVRRIEKQALKKLRRTRPMKLIEFIED